MPAGPRPMSKAQIAAFEKRKRIYDLHAEGHSWEEVGRAMGLEGATCEKYYRKSIKRGEFEALPSQAGGDRSSLALREPENAAEVIAGMAESSLLNPGDARFKRLREACKEAGMKPSLVNALILRLQRACAPVADEVKRLTTKQLLDTLEEKTALALRYIDDYAMSQAGLKDLSIATDILIKNQQLLKNQPTQIIDFTMRQQIGQLMPQMLAEARRRGIMIEGAATRLDESR